MDVDINCTPNRREFLKDMTFFDIYASALVTAPSGDPQYFFTTSCLPGMSYNFGDYENAEVSAMIEELSTEFDTAKRSELAIRLQQANYRSTEGKRKLEKWDLEPQNQG